MADIENENNNNVNEVNESNNSDNGIKKNWLTTLILCWFLGFLGVHRLYAGKLGSGFLMLYGTVVSAAILYLDLVCGLIAFTIMGAFVVNDFLRIATKTFKDCYGNYIVEEKI